MANEGRNFFWAQPPEGNERQGRFALTTAASVPIGAPVLAAAAGDVFDGLGLRRMELAAEDSDRPLPGQGGIAIYEHAWHAFNGYDPVLTQYSDIGDCPAGKALQVIQSRTAIAGFINTEDESFFGQRDYDGRTMVAGIGATPTLVEGDLLTPGDGTNEIWKKTTDPDKGWLVVVRVDGNELLAQLNF